MYISKYICNKTCMTRSVKSVIVDKYLDEILEGKTVGIFENFWLGSILFLTNYVSKYVSK